MALVAIAASSAACASTHPRGLADRFVTRGMPAVDLGGPRLVVPGDGEGARRVLAAAVPRDRASTPGTPPAAGGSVSAPTLEATSPALSRALAALALAPTSEHYLEAAQAYLAEGIRDRAYDYVAAGLARDHRHPALHDAMARLWRDWGMLDRALTSAHTAVYYAPQSPEARNTLGTVLWRLGRKREAARAFDDAVQLAPEAAYAWQNLCQAVFVVGDTRRATAVCQQAARLTRRAGRSGT